MIRRLVLLAVAVMAIVLVQPWLRHAAATVSSSQVTLPPLPLPTTTTAVPTPPTTAEASTTVVTTATSVAETTTAPPVTSASTTSSSELAPVVPGETVVPSTTAVPVPATEPPAQRVVGQALSSNTVEPASTTGAYGFSVGAVLAFVFVIICFLSVLNRGGGSVINAQRRWRLIAGVISLAAAAVVGIVGYLRLSLEPQVNRQIPYLASAGMALVLLAAIGASLIVAEQLRADDQRLDELETAVRQLADSLAPSIEAPARRETA
jgi:hypothetical protein